MKFILTYLLHFGLCDTVARSLRKLKLIKTFSRVHMTDSRLSSLAMLSIEASCVRSLDLDDVIKAFACQKTCSKLFCYCYDVTSDCRQLWRLVVKLAGRAAKFNIWLNIRDCRPSCFYN